MNIQTPLAAILTSVFLPVSPPELFECFPIRSCGAQLSSQQMSWGTSMPDMSSKNPSGSILEDIHPET